MASGGCDPQAQLFDHLLPKCMTPPVRSWIDNDNERPAWLDLAHKKLDAAIAAAYGWPADLNDEQLLERLLGLNHERAKAEAKAAKPT